MKNLKSIKKIIKIEDFEKLNDNINKLNNCDKEILNNFIEKYLKIKLLQKIEHKYTYYSAYCRFFSKIILHFLIQDFDKMFLFIKYNPYYEIEIKSYKKDLFILGITFLFCRVKYYIDEKEIMDVRLYNLLYSLSNNLITSLTYIIVPEGRTLSYNNTIKNIMEYSYISYYKLIEYIRIYFDKYISIDKLFKIDYYSNPLVGIIVKNSWSFNLLDKIDLNKYDLNQLASDAFKNYYTANYINGNIEMNKFIENYSFYNQKNRLNVLKLYNNFHDIDFCKNIIKKIFEINLIMTEYNWNKLIFFNHIIKYKKLNFNIPNDYFIIYKNYKDIMKKINKFYQNKDLYNYLCSICDNRDLIKNLFNLELNDEDMNIFNYYQNEIKILNDRGYYLMYLHDNYSKYLQIIRNNEMIFKKIFKHFNNNKNDKKYFLEILDFLNDDNNNILDIQKIVNSYETINVTIQSWLLLFKNMNKLLEININELSNFKKVELIKTLNEKN